MYNIDFWYMCPILLIPWSIIWALLDTAWEKKKLDEIIANKHGWRKRKVKRWLHGIMGMIGFVVASALILVLSLIFRFNLISWESM